MKTSYSTYTPAGGKAARAMCAAFGSVHVLPELGFQRPVVIANRDEQRSLARLELPVN